MGKDSKKELKGTELEQQEKSEKNNIDDLFEYKLKKDRSRLIKFISIPVLIVILAAIAIFAVFYFPISGGTAHSPVRINEIMPTSDSCPNVDGVFCDYIELYNDSDSDVDISGYQLTDYNLSPGLVFDSGTIVSANGYLVVSCDGSNQVHEAGRAVYAPFSISRSGGEKIILKNYLGAVIDSVTTQGLSKNEAMVFMQNGQWGTLFAGTPGFENSEAGREGFVRSIKADNGIVITELMAKNVSSIVSADGERYDWIELTNTSEKQINIGGYHISDDPIRLAGYTLPSYLLEPEESVIIYASKNAEYKDSEIHTDFSLSSEGETLLLTSPEGKLVCVLEYPELPKNNSYMLDGDSYVISEFSSPGLMLTEPEENEYEGLTISELMPVNTVGIMDTDGDFSDWIELSNDSSGDLELSGCWLSVDSEEIFGWKLPDITVKSGESIIIFASGKETDKKDEMHADFKLPSVSGTLTLASSTGYIIDSVSYETSQPDRSLERTQDGLESTAYSSPGYANGMEGYITYQESLEVESELIISEVMSANDSVLAQAYGVHYDWVEIINTGDDPLLLSDYYLTDDPDNKKLWRMPEITLEPGKYKVFLCSGDESLSTEKYAHTNFSLNSETETLFLYDKNGDICDRMLLCDIPANASAGRMDGQNGLFIFAEPTPGKQNEDGVRAVSGAPYSTTTAGLYEEQTLTIPLFADGDIYYTTDGSWPSSKSKEYTEPITITSSTVVRAITYNEGSMKSSVTTLSFFLNEGNTLPIMSLSANPSDLWKTSTGIYSSNNAFKDWEKDAHIEFFDPEGEGFSIDCGLSLFGGGTRLVSSKKSFQVRFRSIYGKKSLCYDMFEGCDVNEFKSLVFRAGQDSMHTIFRDEIFSSIALEESPTLLAQHYRYCLLFINGKFFGIYCIKERLGDDYYAAHYNVSIDSVEVLKGPIKKDAELYELMSFVYNKDMRIEENYEYVESKIDLDSLIDWYIFEACSGNNDISGNVRYIRSSEGDGKWRLALFDLDFTLRWPINNFEWLYNSHNQHAMFLKGLIKNPEFRDKFLSRFGYLLNNVFTEDNLQLRIEELADELRNDVARDRKKWHSNLTYDAALKIISNVLHEYDYRGRIIKSVASTLKLTSEEKEKYFGI